MEKERLPRDQRWGCLNGELCSANIVSNQSYSGLSVTIQIDATDEMPMKMCVSNTGYEVGCTWEDYVSNKSWNLSGSLDGTERLIYVTLEDGAGNRTRQEFSYQVYSECKDHTTIQYGEFGSCNCEEKLKNRVNTIIDSNTLRVCSTKVESVACNDCP